MFWKNKIIDLLAESSMEGLIPLSCSKQSHKDLRVRGKASLALSKVKLMQLPD